MSESYNLHILYGPSLLSLLSNHKLIPSGYGWMRGGALLL
jgi:hypothetical protein